MPGRPHVEGDARKDVDGDTVELRLDGVTVKARIVGIDAPESVHPIQQSLILWGRPWLPLNPYALAIVAGVLSVLAGFLSWHLIEKPFLAFKPRSRK